MSERPLPHPRIVEGDNLSYTIENYILNTLQDPVLGELNEMSTSMFERYQERKSEELLSTTFVVAHSLSIVKKTLEDNKDVILSVAREAGTNNIIGYCATVQGPMWEPQVGIHENYQNRGIGTELSRANIESLKMCNITEFYASINEGSLRLCQKLEEEGLITLQLVGQTKNNTVYKIEINN